MLLRSRRRCCLCFGFDRDATQKNGQLAHIDRNPAKSAADDLAFLCLDHHNEYDSLPRQTKRLTSRELRRYKAQLESAVERGEIAKLAGPPGLRWAAINMADESMWFDLQPSGGEDFVNFSWPRNGPTVPKGKYSDPIFDVTLINSSSEMAVVSSVGIEVVRSFTKLAGLPPARKIRTSKFLKLDFKWLPGKPQLKKLPDPLALDPRAPVRFKLQLAGFLGRVPGNFMVLKLLCRSDRGLLESEGICLAA